MTIVSFERSHASFACGLWTRLNEATLPDAHFPINLSCQLFDTKTGRFDGARITGRAQNARCIYCNKQIASWGVVGGKAKRHQAANGGGRYIPQAFEDAHHKHTDACAEAWLWGKLARWSTRQLASDAERIVIESWRYKLERRIVRAGDWDAPVIRNILAMFDRLPTTDMEVVQAIELGLIGSKYVLSTWPDNWHVDPHGTGNNPHVYTPSKVPPAHWGHVGVDAGPYGTLHIVAGWHRCPCGDALPRAVCQADTLKKGALDAER